MIKAYQLIDSPQKWSRYNLWEDETGEWPGVEFNPLKASKWCALGAIYATYGMGSSGREPKDRLRALIGPKICQWNINNDWQTVYRTLKELDI